MVRLAEACEVDRSTVSYWISGRLQPYVVQALTVRDLTGIDLETWRLPVVFADQGHKNIAKKARPKMSAEDRITALLERILESNIRPRGWTLPIYGGRHGMIYAAKWKASGAEWNFASGTPPFIGKSGKGPPPPLDELEAVLGACARRADALVAGKAPEIIVTPQRIKRVRALISNIIEHGLRQPQGWGLGNSTYGGYRADWIDLSGWRFPTDKADIAQSGLAEQIHSRHPPPPLDELEAALQACIRRAER